MKFFAIFLVVCIATAIAVPLPAGEEEALVPIGGSTVGPSTSGAEQVPEEGSTVGLSTSGLESSTPTSNNNSMIYSTKINEAIFS